MVSGRDRSCKARSSGLGETAATQEVSQANSGPSVMGTVDSRGVLTVCALSKSGRNPVDRKETRVSASLDLKKYKQPEINCSAQPVASAIFLDASLTAFWLLYETFLSRDEFRIVTVFFV